MCIKHYNKEHWNNQFLLVEWNRGADNEDDNNPDDIVTEENEKNVVDIKHCKI